MILAFLMLAWTLIAPVLPPSGYESAAAQIPAAHWALIEKISVDPSFTHGETERDRAVIRLPVWKPGRAGTLKHEVGHVVLNADDQLREDFRKKFWPKNSPRGTPCYRPSYPTKKYREDFAECYEAYLDNLGHLEDKEREQFMRERVFRGKL